MAKLVSKVYGEALFEVAVDHGNAIRLMNETAELQKILEDNPDFDKLMKHPGIPKQEKLSMVEKVFPGLPAVQLVADADHGGVPHQMCEVHSVPSCFHIKCY